MIKRVYLEITNKCNLKCPFCTNEKGNSFMEIDDINNYLNQIKEFTDYIYLHVLGEPLLHPNFESILNLLDEKNMKLQLVTNGTLLKNINILKHKCLRKLSISLHSVNNLNINDNYFKTIDSLLNFKTNTNIELRFYDYDSLDIKLKSYLDKLKIRYKLNETPKKNSYKINNNTYIYFSDMFNWPSIDSNINNQYGTCKGAKEQIAILVNSDVTICCLDPKGYNKIGNLKEKTLNEILNSDEYINIIKELNNNKLIKNLCKHCEYRQRFN